MSSDSVRPLRDFISLQRGTTYKGALVGLPGPVLLGLASIEPNGGFRHGSFKTYGGECPEKISLKPGDLYVSLKDVTQSGDLLGSVSRIPSGIPSGRLTQDTVKLIFDGEPICSDFIYWVLRTPNYRDHCRGCATGTTTLGLAREDFLGFPIPKPSAADILLVELLEGIESRITLLRETNATLEAIAQALFKSWFVDFDPVRAKAEGLEPQAVDAPTAALFPDSFEESELGLVPKGWRVGCVGDLAEQKKGSVNPLSTPHEWFEHFSLPAFDNAQAPVIEQGETIKSNKTPLPENAVLLSKLNPHIPRVWLPVKYGKKAVCSTEFLAYSPKGSSSKELIYCLFSAPVFQEQLCQLVTGTSNSHQRVKPDQVLLAKLVIASDPLLQAFSDAMKPLFERVYANRQQAQTLTQLRDTLLPRLISGQLRLPKAEQAVEEALV